MNRTGMNQNIPIKKDTNNRKNNTSKAQIDNKLKNGSQEQNYQRQSDPKKDIL